VRQLEADYSIGESEQKAEMTFGDFGASVSAARCRQASSTPPDGEVYVPHPHGGIVGFGFRPELSLRSAG